MAAASLRVRLTPRAGRDQLERLEAGVLHARVAAPPVDGEANRALLGLLAGRLGVPKSALSLRSGASGRDKVVAVEGMDGAELEARVLRALAPGERG